MQALDHSSLSKLSESGEDDDPVQRRPVRNAQASSERPGVEVVDVEATGQRDSVFEDEEGDAI